MQVCWSHLQSYGGSALKLRQWPNSLLVHTIFHAGPLFWFWDAQAGNQGEERKRYVRCSPGREQAHTQMPWGRTSALCWIQCPRSPLQQQHGTATCQARWSCTVPGMLAATRLNSARFVRDMGEMEAERKGHPLLQRASLPRTPCHTTIA